MAHVSFDLIQETSVSTNGAALTLAGATTGNRTFGSKMVNGDTCFAMASNGAGLFQAALYTWTTGGILTTTAGNVLDGSSGAGAIVTFTGTVTITLSPLASIKKKEQQDAPTQQAPEIVAQVSLPTEIPQKVELVDEKPSIKDALRSVNDVVAEANKEIARKLAESRIAKQERMALALSALAIEEAKRAKEEEELFMMMVMVIEAEEQA